MSQQTLNVNAERLIHNLPQFFQSLSSAVSECIQNATRAGASRITIQVDPKQRILRLQDNGPGVNNPQALFTAAESDWADPTITNPAGLGFFAILGLSDPLVVTNRQANGTGWTATITADAFQRNQFPCTELPLDLHAPTGLTLEAHLKREADLDTLIRTIDTYRSTQMASPILPEWRHAYPITVEWTMADTEPLIIPPHFAATQEWPHLNTPVGSIYAVPTDYTRYPSPLAERQLRIQNESRIFTIPREIFEQAFRDTCPSDLAHIVLESLPNQLLWRLNPTAGVRAQLPERSQLILDTAWNNALTQLVEAITQAFDAPQQQAHTQHTLQDAPPVLRSPGYMTFSEYALPTVIDVMLDTKLISNVPTFFHIPAAQHLTWAGYTPITVSDPYVTDGGWEPEGDGQSPINRSHLWMRHVPIANDPITVDLCNIAGLWTLPANSPHTDSAPQRTIRCDDIQYLPDPIDHWLYVGQARVITVFTNGVPETTLPFAVDLTDRNHVVLILAQSANDPIPVTDPWAELPYAYLIDKSGANKRWEEYFNNGVIEFSSITRQIIRAAEQAWDPTAIEQRRITTAQRRIANAIVAVYHSIDELKTLTPMDSATLEHIENLQHSVEEPLQAIQTALQAAITHTAPRS